VPSPRRIGAFWAAALALSACGAPEADEPAAQAQLPPRPGGARQGRSESARAAVDALLAAPSATTLLAVLGQGHAVARELLGKHTLRYTAEFKLAPEKADKPVVDQPNALKQEVKDELELRWGAGPGEPVRFYLSQKTDKHRGREVIVVDEQAYTKLMHRGWHARPLDGDVHLRWLDEAQRSVHDAVAFAAPALAVTATEEGDVVRVELARAAAVDPALVAAGAGQGWRQRAELTEISGSVTLQRATGLWQSAEVHVRYVAVDEQGRRLLGETHLTGEVEAAADLQVEPPESAQPQPERVRYESERRRLLGGLAGT
jgi:hypothetical protein